MNNNNNNDYIYMTYNNYISLRTNSTKPYLMISELIDNSISSFEVEYNEDFSKWPEGEKVKVDIDIHMNKDNFYKEIHELKYSDNSYICVTDNAFGMTKDTLRKSIELDNKKIVKGSNKNVYGRGLKQAAFYFGMSLEIQTRNKLDAWQMTFDMSKVKSLNENIIRNVKESNYSPRGTKIKISKIYWNKSLKEKDITDKLIPAILTRYWKFIKNNKLDITINTNYKNNLYVLNQNTKYPDFLSVQKLETFLESKEYNEARKGIFKVIDGVNETSSTDYEWDNEKYNIIKEKLKEMIDNNKEFKWTVKGKFGLDNVELELSFWSTGLTSNYSRWRGIYTYDGGRAIYHGPNIGRNTGAYLEWFPRTYHSSGSIDNIFIGEIDITGIKEAPAINDKSEIDFDPAFKEDLNEFIFWNYKIFEKINSFIRKPPLSNEFNEKIVTKELLERYDSYDAKQNSNLVSSNQIKVNKDKKLNGDFYIHDVKWQISLTPDKSSSNDKSEIITKCDINDEKKKISMSYNETAAIWNKANSQSPEEFCSNVLFPILILLAIQFINTFHNYSSSKLRKSINNQPDHSEGIM